MGKEHNKLGEGFDCPMCPKVISTRERSKEHIRSVHFNETKECPDCKQIYALSNYTKHRRFHGVRRFEIGQSRGKPLPAPTLAGYECPNCKKVLRSKGSYFTHISSRCEMNGKKKIAEELQPCPECAKLLSSKWKLRLHIQTVHDNDKSHVCDQCSKGFSTKTQLKGHIEQSHSRQTCENCGISLLNKFFLKKHLV